MANEVKQQGVIAKTVNRAVAEGEEKKRDMRDYVKMMQSGFAKALPKVITPERFTRIALTALSSNRTLMDCTPNSFMGSLMQCAQLGLEPNTPLGQAYLIPYNVRVDGGFELRCQFQLGYKGLIDLAYRSGEMASIGAQCVYSNDEFIYELGLNPKLIHKPADRNRGELLYVYATFKLKNGGSGFEVMTVEDIKAHRRKFSKARTSPWDSNFEEMAKKTVLKKCLKYAPIRTDFATGVVSDGAVLNAVEREGSEMEISINYGEDVTVEAQEMPLETNVDEYEGVPEEVQA